MRSGQRDFLQGVYEINSHRLSSLHYIFFLICIADLTRYLCVFRLDLSCACLVQMVIFYCRQCTNKVFLFSVAEIFLPVRGRRVGREKGVRRRFHAGQLCLLPHYSSDWALSHIHQPTYRPEQVGAFLSLSHTLSFFLALFPFSSVSRLVCSLFLIAILVSLYLYQ